MEEGLLSQMCGGRAVESDVWIYNAKQVEVIIECIDFGGLIVQQL